MIYNAINREYPSEFVATHSFFSPLILNRQLWGMTMHWNHSLFGLSEKRVASRKCPFQRTMSVSLLRCAVRGFEEILPYFKVVQCTGRDRWIIFGAGNVSCIILWPLNLWIFKWRVQGESPLMWGIFSTPFSIWASESESLKWVDFHAMRCTAFVRRKLVRVIL